MSRRRVRADELDLWQRVMRETDPLHKRPAKDAENVRSKSPAKPETRASEPLPKFDLGQAAMPQTETHYFSRTTSDRLKADQLRMDSKAFGRLKRGKLVPEARIDLHGMTLEQAHPVLVRFILTSQSRGLRLVLVITGKGMREDPYDPMPRRRGVLKTQVPQWLRMPPVSQAVLQISEAHRRHGGEGAYYIYLRRAR